MSEWERLLARTVLGPGGCLLWQGATTGNGYGALARGTRGKSGYQRWLAHRYAYTIMVGPIPAGLDLDHLCRVRHCINPEHLEPVTRRENLLRGQTTTAERAAQTSCINGHPFDEANTYRRNDGRNDHTRRCRACHRDEERRRRERKQSAA